MIIIQNWCLNIKFVKKTKQLKGIKKLDLKGRTAAFLELAERIRNLDDGTSEELFENASYYNPWFTKDNIVLAFEGLLSYLNEKKLNVWLSKYDLDRINPKKVGVVMAGNIPMVGIHDFLCVLISGHHLYAKLSSQDEVLIKFISNELIQINPEFEERINYVERLKDIDAVIATGSDNTARYFNYYFSKIPHIIRKNRTSVAVLNGTETNEDLAALGTDIFSYFGLGCRNVSKLFLPKGYDPTTLFPEWEAYSHVADHNKYHNNYHYQKSILLVNLASHLDSGFVLMEESKNLVSPIGMLYYDYYENTEEAKEEIKFFEDKIQCVVSNQDIPGKIKFGKAQMPDIYDFADNIDTMEFLSKL